MSDFDDLITDEGTAPKQPNIVSSGSGKIQPTHQQPPPVVAQRVATQRSGVHPMWIGVFAFTTVMFFVLWASTWITMPTPGPGPKPVDGAYVAIFYDDAEKQDYTQDQITAMDSAAMAQFLDATVTGWHKIDAQPMESLDKLDPIYTEMAKEHRAKLPWVVVRAGKRLGSEPVTTPDDLMNLVKRTVK